MKAKLALLLFSFFFVLLVSEVIVRWLDLPPRPFSSLNVGSYVLSENPILQYEYRPDHQATDSSFDESHRGFQTNSMGLRDREYSISKPAKTFRILVLGDSITAGNGISNLHKIYSKVLEQNLQKHYSNKKIEVLNFGVGGYHTLQEIELLRVKGLQYQPDLIVIGFCLNDFFPNSDGGVVRRLQANLGPKEAGLMQSSAGLLKYSRLAFFVYHRTQSLFPKSPEKQVREPDPVPEGLVLLSRLQKQYRFQVFFFVVPAFFDDFSKYPFKPVHEKLKKEIDRFPTFQLVDLTASFSKISKDGRQFTWDGVHPNEWGHALMANFIEQSIAPSILQSSSP